MADVAANPQIYANNVNDMGRDSHETNLKELVSRFVAQSGKQHLMSKQILFDRWAEYVGDICAQFSECKDLRNGVLFVKVKNAALKFELFGHKAKIIDKINNDLGTIVNDIIFV